MNILQAIILGFVQGMTEFLPVSSSAHISIFGKLMGFDVSGDASPGFTAFTAIIQIGTEIAIIIYFFKDIVRILGAWFRTLPQAVKCGIKRDTTKIIGEDAVMGWLIILGTIPIVVLGVVLKGAIETVFRPLWLTATLLIIFAFVIYISDLVGERFNNQLELQNLTAKRTLFYGFMQCLALMPGVSRSGATISAGRILGFSRSSAARFSFYLAIPSILGASIFEMKNAFGDVGEAGFPGWEATSIATIVSFIVGYAVIAVFMKMISKISLRGFAIYRIIVGVTILALIAFGIISA